MTHNSLAGLPSNTKPFGSRMWTFFWMRPTSIFSQVAISVRSSSQHHLQRLVEYAIQTGQTPFDIIHRRRRSSTHSSHFGLFDKELAHCLGQLGVHPLVSIYQLPASAAGIATSIRCQSLYASRKRLLRCWAYTQFASHFLEHGPSGSGWSEARGYLSVIRVCIIVPLPSVCAILITWITSPTSRQICGPSTHL